MVVIGGRSLMVGFALVHGVSDLVVVVNVGSSIVYRVVRGNGE